MAGISPFRLSDDTLADLDALAASNGGTRTPALRDAIAYWRYLIEDAGRRNAADLTPQEWSLMAHTQTGADDMDELIGRETAVRDWCIVIGQELHGMWEGREVVLQSHKDEQRAAKKLAKKIAGWGMVRGYAMMAALRYFWRHSEAGIAACAAVEVWMTPTAKDGA